MLKDLMKLKKQINVMIETYKDLHPDEEDENYSLGRGVWDSEEVQKDNALKKIREGSYENKFSKSKGKKTTGQSEGHPTLCVYGDT